MAIDNISGSHFVEVQRFRQWWLWLLMIILIAISWWSFIQQIVIGTPFGSKPAPDIMVWIIFILVGIGLPGFFCALKMVTDVRSDMIHVRFFPFVSRSIYFRDIATYKVIEYRPIRQFGGWGIRWSPRSGLAYNVSGNKGLQLELLNNKKILVGTQKPEEFAGALKTAMGR